MKSKFGFILSGFYSIGALSFIVISSIEGFLFVGAMPWALLFHPLSFRDQTPLLVFTYVFLFLGNISLAYLFGYLVERMCVRYGFKKILLTLALLASIPVGLFAAWLNDPFRVIVENEMPEPLSDVTVIVGSHNLQYGTLNPGQRKEKWFFYSGSDSSFQISGTLPSRKLVEVEWGYVTHGLQFQTYIFEFKGDAIVATQK